MAGIIDPSNASSLEELSDANLIAVAAVNGVEIPRVNGPRVIVDLGYPWPSEARPAKERQTAVVKQLGNFTKLARERPELSFPAIEVRGCGVAAIETKLAELAPTVICSPLDLFEDCNSSDVLYLSPDGEGFLNTQTGFHGITSSTSDNGLTCEERSSPVYVIGGIVDRKVKRGRSLARAVEQSVRAVQLPLLPTDIGSPLNIDTVLTMLYYWCAFDKVESAEAPKDGLGAADEIQKGGELFGPTKSVADGSSAASGDLPVSASFSRARHCALHEHHTRHPNQGKHLL